MRDDDPVEIGDGVWWVGARLPDDSFQCHAYLIDNGDSSVLIDPGSPLTIEATMAKVEAVVGIDALRYLVCHHPDPDIAAALPYLSRLLTRDDVVVATEWRARALLKHYGHRFDYYLVEQNGWRIPLSQGRDLQFQLTPYLHFPGALVSYDTLSGTLFSSDLFGGFVPDAQVLVCHDLEYLIDTARPFHQHYMPSTELLSAGLERVRRRWPHLRRIAPQHGHVVPGELVDPMFAALSSLDCGVFALGDADIELQHLLRISTAKTHLADALLTAADPIALVSAVNAILAEATEGVEASLFVEIPNEGWWMWGPGAARRVRRRPRSEWPAIDLPGEPRAALEVSVATTTGHDADVLRILEDVAVPLRAAVDLYLAQHEQRRRSADLRTAAMTDPLTGLGNRRALDASSPCGAYALLSMDIDHFKAVNDTFGHAAGDRVLRSVAAVMRSSVRIGDAVYRLGGEEFLVCLPGADRGPASVIAERIRSGVHELDLTGLAPGGTITVSVGVADVANAAPDEFSGALRAADTALYASKSAGRDRVTVGARG